MDAATFRTLGHQLVEQIAELLASVPDRPVTPDESPSAIREALDLNGPLPDAGADAAALLAELPGQLFEHSLLNAHPRFFGYITAPPAPIGILGDFLAAAVNPNVGARALSPAATEIEVQTVRWIAQLIGYPDDCGGLLVSGGNMANIVCLLAARAARAGWEVRKEGVGGSRARPLVAYCSAETHTWIQKGADLAGLGTDAVRWIATDTALRMDVTALARAIDDDVAAGNVPFLVVGTGGSVSTGAVDPLPELAALCRERKIWFHVDGAYGGFAAAAPASPRCCRECLRDTPRPGAPWTRQHPRPHPTAHPRQHEGARRRPEDADVDAAEGDLQHEPRDPAVGNDQIAAAAHHVERHGTFVTPLVRSDHLLDGRGSDEPLGGTTNAQGGQRRQRDTGLYCQRPITGRQGFSPPALRARRSHQPGCRPRTPPSHRLRAARPRGYPH